MTIANHSNSPNQFSYIILSYLTQDQCEGLTRVDTETGKAAYLSLCDNTYLGLDLFMREGVQVAYNHLKTKYFSSFNSQVRQLQKETPTSDQNTLLNKIIQARNAVFQSADTTSLVNFIPSAIDEWLNGLSQKDLIAAFQKANEVGDTVIVQKIIASKKLEVITNEDLISQRDVALRKAYKMSASKGYIENIHALNSAFSNKIPGYILGEALEKAATHGYPDVMTEIMAEGRLKNISDEKFTKAFLIVTRKGFFEAASNIIASQKFKNISNQDLGMALRNAVEKGRTSIAVALVLCRRFKDMASRDLGLALRYAAEKGHTHIMTAFIYSSRFKDISQEDLGIALVSAALCGHLSILVALISSHRFRDIPHENLGKALEEGATNGHLSIITALISCSRFNDIPKEILGLGLRYAAMNGYADIVIALTTTHRFNEIPTEDLKLALTFATENGHDDMMNALTPFLAHTNQT